MIALDPPSGASVNMKIKCKSCDRVHDLSFADEGHDEAYATPILPSSHHHSHPILHPPILLPSLQLGLASL